MTPLSFSHWKQVWIQTHRLVVFSLCLALAPLTAFAQSGTCNTAVTDRLNLAIGFYRMEIAASHLVEQVQSARTIKRRTQLLEARDGLQNLNKNLHNSLLQMMTTPDANGLCAETPETLAPIHASLKAYSNVVQARWTFTQKRLDLLGKIPSASSLPWDPTEADLWINEPRARYDVWRTIAQATPQQTETSSALFVIGMLTRIEWHSAMALNSSLSQGQNTNAPRLHLINAVNDTIVLMDNWPSPNEGVNSTLWKNLRAIAEASPAQNTADIPKAAPPQGWTAWIGAWLQNYSRVFMQSIPKALSALEDVANG